MTRKIVRYAMAKAETQTLLVQAVNSEIEDGWEPYGQPFTTSSTTGYVVAWHQAVVVYDYIKD